MWLAAGACLTAVIGCWRPWRRQRTRPPTATAAWGAALWMTIGLAAIFWLLQALIADSSSLPGAIWPRSPLRNFPWYHWLFFIALGAAPLSFAEAWVATDSRGWRYTVWALRAGLWAAALFVALSPVRIPDAFPTPPPPLSPWAVIGLLAAWTLPPLGLLYVLDPVAQRQPGAQWPLGLWQIAVFSSSCFLLLGQMQHALAAGALALCLGVLVVLSWLRPATGLPRGTLTVFLLLATVLWAQAMYLVPIHGQWGLPVLFAGAIGALELGQLPWLQRRAGWQRVLLVNGVVLLAGCAAVAWCAVRAG